MTRTWEHTWPCFWLLLSRGYFHLPTPSAPGMSSLVLHPSSDVLRRAHKSLISSSVPLCLPGGGCCPGPEGGHLVPTTPRPPQTSRGLVLALGSCQVSEAASHGTWVLCARLTVLSSSWSTSLFPTKAL